MSPKFDFLVKIDEIYVTSRNFGEMSGTLPTKVFRFSSFVFLILLFGDHQATEYESCEIEMITSQTISIHKIYQDFMGKRYPYSTILEKIVWYFFIYMELEPFSFYFFYHQDTESESREIEMSISKPIYTHKNITKALLDNHIHTLQDRRKILW